MEEIKETVEVEAGISENASRTEYVAVSGARNHPSRRPMPQTPEADASGSSRTRRQSGCPGSSRLRRCDSKGVKPGVRSRQGDDGSFRQKAAATAAQTCRPVAMRTCGGAPWNDG